MVWGKEGMKMMQYEGLGWLGTWWREVHKLSITSMSSLPLAVPAWSVALQSGNGAAQHSHKLYDSCDGT